MLSRVLNRTLCPDHQVVDAQTGHPLQRLAVKGCSHPGLPSTPTVVLGEATRRPLIAFSDEHGAMVIDPEAGTVVQQMVKFQRVVKGNRARLTCMHAIEDDSSVMLALGFADGTIQVWRMPGEPNPLRAANKLG
jgi:hypothetical protein